MASGSSVLFSQGFFKATLEEGHLCRLDSTLLASFPCIYMYFKNEFEYFLGSQFVFGYSF